MALSAVNRPGQSPARRHCRIGFADGRADDVGGRAMKPIRYTASDGSRWSADPIALILTALPFVVVLALLLAGFANVDAKLKAQAAQPVVVCVTDLECERLTGEPVTLEPVSRVHR